MKKIATLAFAGLMTLAMASCQSDAQKAVSLIEDATEALKDAKSQDEVTKISDDLAKDLGELDEKIDRSKLTDEEKAAIDKAGAEYAKVALQKSFGL